MACHPSSDERTQRAYLQAAGSRVIEHRPGQCGTDTLTFIFIGHDSMEEDDGVVGKLVLTHANERAIDPRFVSASHRVVCHRHAHGRQLCQTRCGPRRYSPLTAMLPSMAASRLLAVGEM